MNRISKKFEALKLQQKCAFVAYICAGDPDYESSLKCLKSLPKNGVDIIEIGVPFLTPQAMDQLLKILPNEQFLREWI